MYSPFQLAKKYLKYYFSASNGRGHGVHSPFVFDFIKFVLNDKKEYPSYKKIEVVRQHLLANESVIEVEDFGAGSGVIKSNKRVVKKIAASSLKPKKYAQLLFRIVQYYKPLAIAELGTSFGVTTAYLAAANENIPVYTLEGAKNIASIARQNFAELNLQNIELLQGDFKDTLPLVLEKQKTFGLVFIDGNHREKPTVEYFNKFLASPADTTILIFDDIHWSEEMEAAWTQVKAHERVTVSIDLFFIGIIFLRNEFKVKQHFSIRF